MGGYSTLLEKGELFMRRETFYAYNCAEILAHKLDILRDEGYRIIDVSKGQIKQWGSDIPTAANYGRTEPGYIITVER